MKCENCIHKKPCGEYQQKFLSHLKNLKVTECPYYKEKDKVIELPCKVGDTVWFIKSCFTYAKSPMSGMVCMFKSFSKVGTITYGVIMDGSNINRSFTTYDIGKTVFLSREEAEKALKELKENER